MAEAEPPLNDRQRDIVRHLHGALLVLAPVGTGKTRVLAERVAHAVAQGIPPERILCLTFTNRAAQEMRDRAAHFCPQAVRHMTIKTFHALCAHILRREARAAGLPADFVVYDDADGAELVKRIWRSRDLKEAEETWARVTDCKTRHEPAPSLDDPWEKVYGSLLPRDRPLALQYQRALLQLHALDFADLEYYVRALFAERPEVRERWMGLFDFVQVDEAQDTRLSEYEIVSTLARRGGNLALIGDLAQTIYRWRDSQPEEVIARFRRDYPVEELCLVKNYRATRSLLGAAGSFARSFAAPYAEVIAADGCPAGEPIRVVHAPGPQAEALWIGERVRELVARQPADFRYSRVAILTRSNKQAQALSAALDAAFPDLPLITVEQYEFFRRQEVKDALAHLRLLTHPHDTGAMLRVLKRPGRDVEWATVLALQEEGQTCGLRLSDLVLPAAHRYRDPFGPLIRALPAGDVLVFDVETTGLSAGRDEIVELAAARICPGQPLEEFHAHLRPTVPVGESERIHGLSDAYLAAQGRPAGEVLDEFLAFCTGAVLVGHNVGYDLQMLAAHARRLGLDVPPFPCADTWSLASRFVEAPDYRLETLARHFSLPQREAHHALEDVRMTVDLLGTLWPHVVAGTARRQALLAVYGPAFVPLARRFAAWKKAVAVVRPAPLLARIVEESGLATYYRPEQARSDNLQALLGLLAARDGRQPDLHPETALREILDFTALARNVDHLSAEGNRAVLTTIHQSKGLEFDTVFIAGACEGDVPDFRNRTGEKLDEERRLFYVAMTRARQRLFISSHNDDGYDGGRNPSRFIADIDPAYLRREDGVSVRVGDG